MKIKSSILVFCLMILSGFRFTNKPCLFTILKNHEYFTTDNLNNIYLIKGEEISKYNYAGKFLLNYSNKRFGKITSTDATNALKILLYYKDFQQLVFLDNQLSQNGEPISLENLGLEQAELACTSFNNSFWIYNKQNNELVRFNENSQLIARTGNLKQLLQSDLKPDFMLEHNGFLFLNCPNNGIYMFDMYGTFSKIISIKELHDFQVSNNTLYYFNKNKFHSYDIKTLQENSITIRDSLIQDMRIEKDRIYHSKGDTICAKQNTIE